MSRAIGTGGRLITGSMIMILLLTSARIPADNGRELRLNQIQVIASHNSYHLLPDHAIWRFLKGIYGLHLLPKDMNPRYIDYTHETLTKQLEQYHMHGLELDVWYDPKGGAYYKRHGNAFVWKKKAAGIEALKKPGFKIMHIADFDYNTTNYTFVDALQEIKVWSDAHPSHLPLFINVEVKVDAVGDKVHIGKLVKAVPFDSTAAEALDAEVHSVFGTNLKNVITPDQMRGTHATLEEAALAHDWPLLRDARGKIVFIIDAEGYGGGVYMKGHPSLRGRAMFVFVAPGTPEAAFVIEDDPIGAFQKIPSLAAKGYIVRTQCDESTLEARSGDYTRFKASYNSSAQILSTDYYRADPRGVKKGFTDYHVILPGGTTARVDSAAAPDRVGVKITE